MVKNKLRSYSLIKVFHSSSENIFTPKSFAFSIFDNVGLLPAIRKLVFLDKDEDNFAPNISILTLASALLMLSKLPVIKTVLLEILVSFISLSKLLIITPDFIKS